MRSADLRFDRRLVTMGYDTVFVTAAPVHTGVQAMLDDLHRHWPNMVVAVGEAGTFTTWTVARPTMPAGTGQVFVARDERMEQRWDLDGWIFMERDEGPFAVFYRPSPRPAVEVQFNDDPYDGVFGFEPYSATMVMAGMSLVTVVTPDKDSPFTRQVLILLQQALSGQIGQG
jgi:hypothetical protein